MMKSHMAWRMACVAVAGMLAGCSSVPVDVNDINAKPSFVGAINSRSYDGKTDDLLTGGLGTTKLQSPAAPPFVDPLNPTPVELRVATIHSNYRGMVDMSTKGGYGVLFGPNIDIHGNPTLGEGLIAGEEHIAYADDGSGRVNVTLMVQIPSTFDKKNPCIVTATSSGSRGVYGAIATAGDWGLKHGCAVAYNDKGSGVGFHDLQNNKITLQNGVRAEAATAGKNSNFTASLTADELAEFNAATPNRVAIKQVHSQLNSEKDWGKYTLQGVEFAFYILNQKFGPLAPDGKSHLRVIKPGKTIVIASSASNGAGAALMALEQDTQGLISGLAVAEPVTEVAPNPLLVVKRGTNVVKNPGRGVLDWVTIANLYQPCAALSPSITPLPVQDKYFLNKIAVARCAALKSKGLLNANSTEAQADEALTIMKANGWENEHDFLHASHYAFTTPVLAMMYANMHGKFSVKDNLCGQSLAATSTTFAPTSLAPALDAKLYATANGTPTGGINLINNNAVGGALLDGLSVSPSTGQQDFNIDAALCYRSLVAGVDLATGVPLKGQALADSNAILAGITEQKRTANLHGKPAIIVHGRSDTLIPVNHNSRAYFGVNKIVEGNASKLSYIEVTNAQHFDAFIPAFGYDSRIVPLHPYLVQALDRMYAYLKEGRPLPPSQLVRTTPRGGAPFAAPAITAANLPPIQNMPAAADMITFANNTVTIPD